jgi:hypothetical protein
MSAQAAPEQGLRRRGFIGMPKATWFEPSEGPRFRSLDFVWSLTKAQAIHPDVHLSQE